MRNIDRLIGSNASGLVKKPLQWSSSEQATTVALTLIAFSLFTHVLFTSAQLASYLNPTVWALLLSGLITLAKLFYSVEIRAKLLRPSIEDTIVAGFLFWMWLSVFTSDDASNSIRISLQISLLVLAPYFLIRLLLRDRSDLRLMLTIASLLGAFVGSIVTLLWFINWDFIVLNTEPNRATFFSSNTVPTATVLFLGAAARAGLMAINARKPTVQEVALLAASGWPLFITGTRSPILAVLLLAAIAAVVYGRHKKYRVARAILIWVFITFSATIVTGVLLSTILISNSEPDSRLPRQYFFPTVSRLSHLLLGTGSETRRFDQSISNRFATWTDSLNKIASSAPVEPPTLTVEPTATAKPAEEPTVQPTTDDRTILEKLFTARRIIGSGKGSIHPLPHNIVIETILETGYVGAALLATLFGMIGIKAVRRLNTNLDPYIFTLFMIGFCLLFIKQFSFYMLGNKDLFIITALFVSLTSLAPTQTSDSPVASIQQDIESPE